jgi:hypothetical protein
MTGEIAAGFNLEYVTWAWHDYVYYILVVALAVAWTTAEFRHIWFHLKGERRKAAIKGHVLWALLTAAFLAGVARYEFKLTAITETLDKRMTTTTEELSEINGRLAQVDLERISTVRDRLDPIFNKVFGPRLEAALENLKTAIRDKRIVLGADDFKSLYVETLRQMKGHTILALSYPKKEYFWDAHMMEVVAAFVKTGGTMKRIFFLDKPAVPKDDAYEIMNGQQRSGIAVYYVMKEDVPRDKQIKFLVDEDNSAPFAWYVQVDEAGVLEKSIGTSDRNQCREYVDRWHDLYDHYAKPFVPVDRK